MICNDRLITDKRELLANDISTLLSEYKNAIKWDRQDIMEIVLRKASISMIELLKLKGDN